MAALKTLLYLVSTLTVLTSCAALPQTKICQRENQVQDRNARISPSTLLNNLTTSSVEVPKNTTEKLPPSVENVLENIKNQNKELLKKIEEIAGSCVDAKTSLFNQIQKSIQEKFKSVLNTLKQTIQTIIIKIKQHIDNTLGKKVAQRMFRIEEEYNTTIDVPQIIEGFISKIKFVIKVLGNVPNAVLPEQTKERIISFLNKIAEKLDKHSEQIVDIIELIKKFLKLYE